MLVNIFIPIAAIIVGIGMLFAHARFVLRFARVASHLIPFAAIWCLLGLGSWLLFTLGAGGLLAIVFRVTEIALIDEFAAFLHFFLAGSSIFYLLLFAVLGGQVAKQVVGGGLHAVLIFALTLILSFYAIAMYVGLSMYMFGHDLIG